LKWPIRYWLVIGLGPFFYITAKMMGVYTLDGYANYVPSWEKILIGFGDSTTASIKAAPSRLIPRKTAS
jgi:hypothetical protein